VSTSRPPSVHEVRSAPGSDAEVPASLWSASGPRPPTPTVGRRPPKAAVTEPRWGVGNSVCLFLGCRGEDIVAGPGFASGTDDASEPHGWESEERVASEDGQRLGVGPVAMLSH